MKNTVRKLWFVVAAGLATAATACGSDGSASGDGCADATDCAQSDDATQADDDGTGDDGTGDDGTAAAELPCDVAEILAASCSSCHADPPQFGAAMPLTTLEHFRVPAVTEPAASVADLVLLRTADDTSPMPPDGSLSDADRSVLTDWIASGMPGENAECEGVSDDGDDGDDEPWGPDALPCEPDHIFLASNAAGDAGFHVPEGAQDLYQCFVFDAPFTDKTQGIAWAPVIDDERVVHHWLLLRAAPDVPTGVAPCSEVGAGFDSPMIMGWAPGTPNFVMPDEAGLELPGPGDKVILQIHYNNSAGVPDAIDSSGVAMCTTEEPRDNLAATLWLGSLQIDVPPGGTQEVSYDCDTGRIDEPVHMLLSWPHMHENGTSIKTELIRDGDGSVEMLADVPQWNFNNQIYYPHSPAITINPGDTLRTTCTYANDSAQPVTFGEGTGDEMCFDFSIVYPITAFDFVNPIGPPELGRYCIDYGSGFP